MSEFRSVVCLEVWEFSQESGYLSDDSEKIIRSWMIVHLEAFDSLVVFYDGVERSFL